MYSSPVQHHGDKVGRVYAWASYRGGCAAWLYCDGSIAPSARLRTIQITCASE